MNLTTFLVAIALVIFGVAGLDKSTTHGARAIALALIAIAGLAVAVILVLAG